jgi:hypothetical protein
MTLNSRTTFREVNIPVRRKPLKRLRRRSAINTPLKQSVNEMAAKAAVSDYGALLIN